MPVTHVVVRDILKHVLAGWQVAAGLQQSALVLQPASIVATQTANLAAGIKFSMHVPSLGKPILVAIQLVPFTHSCPAQSCPHMHSGKTSVFIDENA